MPTPAKPTKPKLIPLTELRALCKEAGVEVFDNATGKRDGFGRGWDIERDCEPVAYASVRFGPDKYFCRQCLKALCLGLIAMRKRGEL